MSQPSIPRFRPSIGAGNGRHQQVDAPDLDTDACMALRSLSEHRDR